MRRQLLIVCTDRHVEPRLLTVAVTEALAREPGGITVARVLIPAVLPSTLPISAWPPGLAHRLDRLRCAAEAIVAARRPPGRVEITACRSLADLLAAAWPVDALVLVGGAGWRVRRAVHGLAHDVVVVPSQPARRRAPTPSPKPAALPHEDWRPGIPA
jgi:hypothetical protein